MPTEPGTWLQKLSTTRNRNGSTKTPNIRMAAGATSSAVAVGLMSGVCFNARDPQFRPA